MHYVSESGDGIRCEHEHTTEQGAFECGTDRGMGSWRIQHVGDHTYQGPSRITGSCEEMVVTQSRFGSPRRPLPGEAGTPCGEQTTDGTRCPKHSGMTEL